MELLKWIRLVAMVVAVVLGMTEKPPPPEG